MANIWRKVPNFFILLISEEPWPVDRESWTVNGERRKPRFPISGTSMRQRTEMIGKLVRKK